MSYFRYHMFFCTNSRTDDQPACGNNPTVSKLREYAKKRCKELGISHPGHVRINPAGCLNRCDRGPVAVVYPEDVWYTFVDQEDIEEIIQEHFLNGRIVKRLQVV